MIVYQWVVQDKLWPRTFNRIRVRVAARSAGRRLAQKDSGSSTPEGTDSGQRAFLVQGISGPIRLKMPGENTSWASWMHPWVRYFWRSCLCLKSEIVTTLINYLSNILVTGQKCSFCGFLLPLSCRVFSFCFTARISSKLLFKWTTNEDNGRSPNAEADSLDNGGAFEKPFCTFASLRTSCTECQMERELLSPKEPHSYCCCQTSACADSWR